MGEWRRLYSEEHNSSYRLPNAVRVIKPRIFAWAKHVARMKESTNAFNILTGNPTGKRSPVAHIKGFSNNA